MTGVTASGRREFHAVTSVRGIASLAVCLFHLGLWTKMLPDGLLKTAVSAGWLGPHVFFIVSGFVVPWSLYVARYRLSQSPRYLARRLVRLDPPYFATIAMVLALQWVASVVPLAGQSTFHWDWVQLGSHIAYLTGFLGESWYNPVFWTLAIEFQFYLLLALMFPLLAHPSKYVRWGFMLLGIAVFLPHFGEKQTLLLSGYMPLFMLGFVLFQRHAKIIGDKEFWVWTVPLLGLCVSYIPILALYALLAVLVMLEDRFRCRATEFLGKISYSLYLIHMPVGISFQRIAEHFVHTDWHRFLAVLLSLALCLFAAWVFYHLVERPAMVMARKISLRRNNNRRLSPEETATHAPS